MPCRLQLLVLFFSFSIASCDSHIPLEPLSDNAVILAFGDSLTFGTGANYNQSYPAHLQNLINKTVINSGVPGEISLKGLRRLPTALKRHKPELVLLCHGANDILRKLDLNATKSHLQSMIDLIRQSGAQVIILAAPNFELFLPPSIMYLELAETNQVPILEDTLSGILLNPAKKSDQIHPNAEGYKIIAEKIKTFLEKSGALLYQIH